MTEADFEEIEHTADWALRVRGASAAALFVAAARGMFSLLGDLSQIEERRRVEVELDALDTETLLIDWLNELLYIAEENGIVLMDFTLHEFDTDPARLRASAWGGPPVVLNRSIKAATFSSLRIVRDARGYSAEIVFDV